MSSHPAPLTIGELGRAIRDHHLVQVRYKGEQLRGEPYLLTLCPRSGVLSLLLHSWPEEYREAA